jgi:hypothetical protein
MFFRYVLLPISLIFPSFRFHFFVSLQSKTELTFFASFPFTFCYTMKQNENGYRLEKLYDYLNIFLRFLQIFPDFHFMPFCFAVFNSFSFCFRFISFLFHFRFLRFASMWNKRENFAAVSVRTENKRRTLSRPQCPRLLYFNPSKGDTVYRGVVIATWTRLLRYLSLSRKNVGEGVD